MALILISTLLAIAIHVVPVTLKIILDPISTLSPSNIATLAGLVFLQVTVTILPTRKARLLAIGLLLPLTASSLLNFMSLSLFKSPVSLSAVVAILQSNPEEAKEFADAYGSRLVFAASGVLIVFALLFSAYLKAKRPRSFRPALLSLAIALLCFSPLMMKAFNSPKLAAWDLHEVAYSDRLFTSLVRYRGQIKAWNEQRERWAKRGNVEKDLELKIVNPKKMAPLVIVVVGESTTRKHMGIYGYDRNTTPRLAGLRDNLVIFRDVITPTAHTVPAVMGALCADKMEPGTINCGGATLIDIARGVGYKTTWISNQTQVGFDDSSLVQLGRSADRSFFVNQDASSAAEADRNTSLDEKIFAPLLSTLEAQNSTESKDMIFIHLMGTHFTYEKRYPQARAVFKDESDIVLSPIVKDDEAKALINHYDNAVAYQDQVLSQIFTLIKDSGREAIGFYFSDHGEEVFQSANFHGHSDDNLTRAMSEIPSILVTSTSYAHAHAADLEAIRQYQSRPFISNQLTPSLADLLGIQYKTLKPEESLFSKQFKPAPRMTAKGLYEHELHFGQQ